MVRIILGSAATPTLSVKRQALACARRRRRRRHRHALQSNSIVTMCS